MNRNREQSFVSFYFFPFTTMKTNKKLNRFVRDVHWKPSLREELKNNAHELVNRYGITDVDIRAVQADDADTLIARGMDQRLTVDPAPRFVDKARITTARLAAGAMMLLFGFTVGTPFAQAKRRVDKRTGYRYAVLRVGKRALVRAGKRARTQRASARIRTMRMRFQERDPILGPIHEDDSIILTHDPIR